jgi:hypothetical protein
MNAAEERSMTMVPPLRAKVINTAGVKAEQ